MPWSAAPILAGLHLLFSLPLLVPMMLASAALPRSYALASLAAAVAAGGLSGLALALADRSLVFLGRAGRWAVGMGLAGAVPLNLAGTFAQGVSLGQVRAVLAALAVMVGYGAVHGALKGLALGWSAASAPGRYGRMAAAGAIVGLVLSAFSLVVIALQMRAAHVRSIPWTGLTTQQGISLAATVLQALALAWLLTRAEAQSNAPGRDG